LEDRFRKYEPTIFQDRDRALYEAMRTAWTKYVTARAVLLNSSGGNRSGDAKASPWQQVVPAFQEFYRCIEGSMEFNKATADNSIAEIRSALARARIAISCSFIAGLIIAALSGFGIARTINRPMKEVLEAVDVMGNGDFTERLELERKDEFGS